MIGYAPSEWDGLCLQLGRNKEQKEQLVELKLASEKTPGRQFDFFRDRLMFPIRDKRGTRYCIWWPCNASRPRAKIFKLARDPNFFIKALSFTDFMKQKQAHKKT